MIGGSYGGQIQYAVAMQDKRVDALIPIITWNDLSYSLAPNNTDLARGVTYRTPGVAKKEWVDLFFGVGIADGVAGRCRSTPAATARRARTSPTRPARPRPRLNTARLPRRRHPRGWPGTRRSRRT